MKIASTRSLRGLDTLNLVLADVRDGLGPYLAIYLAAKHWDPSRVGLAMGAMGVATVIAQTPAGELVDRTRRKRSWMIAAAVAVAVGAVAMARSPTLPVVLGSQALIGAAAAIFAPAIAAVSLGLVGHRLMARRTGRTRRSTTPATSSRRSWPATSATGSPTRGSSISSPRCAAYRSSRP